VAVATELLEPVVVAVATELLEPVVVIAPHPASKIRALKPLKITSQPGILRIIHLLLLMKTSFIDEKFQRRLA